MKKKNKVVSRKFTKKRFSLKSKLGMIVVALTLFLGGSIYLALSSGTGPFSSLLLTNSINKVASEEDCGTGWKWDDVKGCVRTNNPAVTRTLAPVATPKASVKPKGPCDDACGKNGYQSACTSCLNRAGNTPPAPAIVVDDAKTVCETRHDPKQTCVYNNKLNPPCKCTDLPGGAATPETGKAGCGGGLVPIKDGQTVPSGHMFDGDPKRMECFTCKNGAYINRQVCADALAKDPKNTILPVNAGDNYTGGAKPPKPCLDSTSGNVGNTASGNLNSKGEYCFNGEWLPKGVVPSAATGNAFCKSVDASKPEWNDAKGICQAHVPSAEELRAQQDKTLADKIAAQQIKCAAEKPPKRSNAEGTGCIPTESGCGKDQVLRDDGQCHFISCSKAGKNEGGCKADEICTPVARGMICRATVNAIPTVKKVCNDNLLGEWSDSEYKWKNTYCPSGCNTAKTDCSTESAAKEDAYDCAGSTLMKYKGDKWTTVKVCAGTTPYCDEVNKKCSSVAVTTIPPDKLIDPTKLGAGKECDGSDAWTNAKGEYLDVPSCRQACGGLGNYSKDGKNYCNDAVATIPADQVLDTSKEFTTKVTGKTSFEQCYEIIGANNDYYSCEKTGEYVDHDPIYKIVEIKRDANQPVITYSLKKGTVPIGDECYVPGDCESGFCANRGNVIFTKNTCELPKSDSQLITTISNDGKYLENMSCKNSDQCASGLYCNKRFLLIPNVCQPLADNVLLEKGQQCYPSSIPSCDLCPTTRTWVHNPTGNSSYICD